MNIILVAEKEEIKLIDKLIDGGHLDHGWKHANIFVTGVGALNVIESLGNIKSDGNLNILNVGYAGSKNLEPNKFYSVTHTTLYHPNVDYPEFIYGLHTINDDFKPTHCYSGSDFVLDTKYENCVFDMELAYICATLKDAHIYCVKYVSDNLDLKQYRETLNND